MKNAFWRFVMFAAAVCSLTKVGCAQKQCDVHADPNCFFSLLPPAPPAPDSTQVAPLSTDDTIKFAYNTITKAQSNPTGTVMDVGIAAISIGYPPAGLALGIFKGLIDSADGGSDPVGQELQQINARIDGLQGEINNIESTVNNLQNQVLKDENEESQNWLQADYDVIVEDKDWLAKHPTDPADIARTLRQLHQTANHFIDRPKRWMWSDTHVYTDKNGVLQQPVQMDPDFKSQPAFDIYSHALVLWMAGLQYASKGDPSYITSQTDVVYDLLRHAAFLSVEPTWQGWNPVHTLPEQVMKHAECGLDWVTLAGRPGTPGCQARISCKDYQRHTKWTPPNYPAIITFTPKNGGTGKQDWCEAQGQLLVADAQFQLWNYYGYTSMQELAAKLVKLAETGSLADQFIGQFDMTYYSQERLYAVKPNGELLMFHHVIGVDKNPPERNAQGSACSWRLGKTCVSAGSLQAAAANTQPASRNNLVTTMRLDAVRQTGPKVVHKLEGPLLVGTAWQQFRRVIPAGTTNVYVQTAPKFRAAFVPKSGQQSADNRGLVPAGGTAFYAIGNDGSLFWYRQDSIRDPKMQGGYSYQWKGPIRVAAGFGAYKQVFSGGDGVIYAIGTDGSLNIYRFANFQDATSSASPAPAPAVGRNRLTTGVAHQYEGPNRIATGWGNFTQVFSTGEGILYAVTPDGRLLWFKDLGSAAQGGLFRVAGPKQVGSGWTNMKRVYSPGDGVIYAISASGELFWYKHDGYKDGSPRWQGPTKIAAGWSNFTEVFPWMPTAANPSAVH